MAEHTGTSDFDMCMKNGGTMKKMMVKGKMTKVCYDKMGKAHMGEMMPEKKKGG